MSHNQDELSQEKKKSVFTQVQAQMVVVAAGIHIEVTRMCVK